MTEQDSRKNAFGTFPLANTDSKEADSDVSIPSESDVKEVRDWVDFKGM